MTVKKRTKKDIQKERIEEKGLSTDELARLRDIEEYRESGKKLEINKDILKEGYGNIFLDTSFLYEKARISSNYIHIPDSLSFSYFFQCGGPPIGRVMEIGGREGSFKSTIAALIGVMCRFMGFRINYFDIEHKQDAGYLESIGLDLRPTLPGQPTTGDCFIRPKTAEQVQETISSNTSLGARRVLYILDSATAMQNKWERQYIDKSLDEDKKSQKIGNFATFLGIFLKDIVPGISETDSMLIIINQMRAVKKGAGFGLDTTGGNALKFYESSKFIAEKIYTKEGEGAFKSLLYADSSNTNRATHRAINMKMVKTSSGAPIDDHYIFFELGKGFSKEWELLHLGVIYGIIEKKGAGWMSLVIEKTKGENDRLSLGQSPESGIKFLKKNIKYRNYIEDKLRLVMDLPSRADIKESLHYWKNIMASADVEDKEERERKGKRKK